MIPRAQSGRPWYCRDIVVDEYRKTLTTDGEPLPMLKALKLLRAIIVNLGIIGISTYSVAQGGDPTILGILALFTLGTYNGLEISDYAAMLQAVQEIQQTADEQSTGGDDNQE